MDLIYEYLPSIVITLANFITPLLFSIIINYEDYSPAFEIRFTLMRCSVSSALLRKLGCSVGDTGCVKRVKVLTFCISAPLPLPRTPPPLPRRCVFMRLTSVGVLLFSLWFQITTCKDKPCDCGYNHDLYSVSLFLDPSGVFQSQKAGADFST